MNKQELIKKYEDLFENLYAFPVVTIGEVLGDLQQLDEPQKVTIPQFIADLIEEARTYEWDLDDLFEHISDYSGDSEVSIWFYTLGNIDVLARAWLDGYTVEEEKRYRVKMKNAYYNKYHQFLCETDNGIFWAAEKDLRKTKFTRKELEQAGFGWVFDCPVVEIEEVEK